MKNANVFWFVNCLMLCVIISSSPTYGIGIFPARWTVDIPENSFFSQSLTYSLPRAGTRYSSFRVNDAAGLNVSITGSNSAGVQHLDDKSLLIDWQSPELCDVSSITASVLVNTPTPWQCPVAPGGNNFLGDLAVHTELEDISSGIGGVTAAVSEISFWRNYALKANVLNLQDMYQAGTNAQFAVHVKDYYVGNGFLKWFDFSYSIDWESDGIVDVVQSGIRMTDEQGRTGGNDISSGFKYKELDLQHIFAAPGSYIVTLSLKDSIETTTMQIPVTVIPEPLSIALVGIGGMLIRRRTH